MRKTAAWVVRSVLGAVALAAAPAFADTVIRVQVHPQRVYPGPQYPSAQHPGATYPRSQIPGGQYPGPHFQAAPRHFPPPQFHANDPRARWAYQDAPQRRERDFDRDGIPDRYDRDLDNDGIRNRRDRDIDGDGVPNWHDRRPENPYRY